MEKKIEVEIGGRKVRIMSHMLADAAKFGATQQARIVKETPKELIKAVKEPLPQMKEVKQEAKVEPLPEVTTKAPETVKAVRKTPVRSKAKK